MTNTSAKPDLIDNPARHAERTRAATRRPHLDLEAAVGYARSATTTANEVSVDRQVDAIRRAATARRLELVQVFTDREASRTRGDHEGRSAMLAFLRTSVRRPATVIVKSVDRLARDARVLLTLWDELRELGVALHDVESGAVDMRAIQRSVKRTPSFVRGDRFGLTGSEFSAGLGADPAKT